MFFENMSQLKALGEVKVVPKESFVLNTLLRRGVLIVPTVPNECVARDFIFFVTFRAFRSVRAIAGPGGVIGSLPRPIQRWANHRKKIAK